MFVHQVNDSIGWKTIHEPNKKEGGEGPKKTGKDQNSKISSGGAM